MGDKWDRHPATDGFVFRADLPRVPAGPGAEDESTGDRQQEGEANSHGAPPRFSHDSNIAGLADILFGQEWVHQRLPYADAGTRGGRPAISALLVRHSDAAQFGDASDFDPFHDEDVSLVVEAGAVRAIQLAGLLALAAERADVLALAALSLVAWTVWCYYSAARSTVHTLAQMGPPILNVAAARGFGTCKPAGALPSSCSALQPIMAIPVAPMGCPLAMSPPDVLMAHSPPGAALPSTQYWAPLPGSALPITSVPSAPITVKQSCTSATFTSSAVRRAIR